jgi:predicted nucleic acid-binding protein
MIVIADTSPVNYLVLIDEVDILPDLFGRVLIPMAVFRELQNLKAPLKVREWTNRPPAWLEVRDVASTANVPLMDLDIGEREAIQLALELGIDMVLMDESDGRQRAEMLHLEVRGTLGILERGAKLGRIDFRRALNKLELTSFRLSPAVRSIFLQRNPGGGSAI